MMFVVHAHQIIKRYVVFFYCVPKHVNECFFFRTPIPDEMRSRSTVSVIHGLLRSNCRSWVDMVRAADSVEQDLKVQASCVKQDQNSVPCLLIRYHRSLSDHHFGQLMPYTYYFLSMLPAFPIRMPIREQEGTLKKIMIDKADKLRNRDRKRGSEIMEQQIAC